MSTSGSIRGPRNRLGGRYDWDKWLKVGTTTILKYGKDYSCTTNSMAVNIRLASGRKQHNVEVSVSILDNETIRVIVHNKRGEEAPPIKTITKSPMTKPTTKPIKSSK